MSPVVIISPAYDAHGMAVYERLRDAGVDVRLLDTLKFPESLRITLGDRLEEVVVDGELLRPAAVYARDLGLNPMVNEGDFEAALAKNWRRTMAAARERAEVVTAMLHRWEDAGVPIYNPLGTRHRITKPYQIGMLAAAGLPVPETIWTNDPSEVRVFANGRRVAYKPVVGGAATKELAERDLTDERLALLGSAPVCFQELLPGEDLRVYVLDGRVIAAIRIETDAIDFRQNEKALVSFPIDDALADVCIRATSVLGLRFTGMDLKADAAGRVKILELNPSPMFLGFDAGAGTDIFGELCNVLAAASRSDARAA